MKIKLFSIFLIFNLIFSSYAHASTIAYDTKMRVGATWNTARTIIRNNPLGKNPQGLILAVGTIYVGDKVVTEYRNGTFDAPLASMKNAVAEMYAAGVKASGWLQEQFDALKKEFICDSNGNCTAAAKQSDRTFKDTKFALKNSTQFFDSISKAVSTSSYATSSNYNGYQIQSILWGSKSLSDAMSSINRTGELTINLSISCLAAIYCGNNPNLTDNRTLTIAFDKAVAMISLSSFHAMLIPILTGMILLAVGFNFRDKNLGVFAMWIGMLTILATVVFKILAKLNE